MEQPTPAKRKTSKRSKGAGGRPTLYKAEYADQGYRLCLLGCTNQDLANFFGVQCSTIDNWLKRHKEFLGAITRGREIADANVAASLYHRALGYSHDAVKILQHEGVPIEVPYTEHYPPDTNAASLWLRNRQPKKWRDKQEVEISGELAIADRILEARKRVQG